MIEDFYDVFIKDLIIDANLDNDTWYHVSFHFKRKNCQIYIDGIAVNKDD